MKRLVTNPKYPSTSGFTLVELLITVVVAAVLVGIAIPSFTTLISNTRIENRANDLFALLTQTRHSSIVSGNLSFICRTKKAVTNVSSSGASCGLTGLAARDWNTELMVYRALSDTVIPTPNATFSNFQIQTLESDDSRKKQMLQSVSEAGGGNLIIVSAANQNVLAFDRTGAMINGAPFRFAICDDRADPENFGRIVEVNQSGQIRLYKTDSGNTDKDCSPTNV
nr:hypothetical protein [uncultured bacterium]